MKRRVLLAPCRSTIPKWRIRRAVRKVNRVRKTMRRRRILIEWKENGFLVTDGVYANLNDESHVFLDWDDLVDHLRRLDPEDEE